MGWRSSCPRDGHPEMTGRRSVRLRTPKRKSLPADGIKTAGAAARATPAPRSASPRPSKRAVEPAPRRPALDATWPLFSQNSAPVFPTDRGLTVQKLAPPSADLAAFAGRPELPPETNRAAPKLRGAPSGQARNCCARPKRSWRGDSASRALARDSDRRRALACVPRSLGRREREPILRVAHIVRALPALRETPRAQQDLHAPFRLRRVLHPACQRVGSVCRSSARSPCCGACATKPTAGRPSSSTPSCSGTAIPVHARVRSARVLERSLER